VTTLHILFTAELPESLARLWSTGDSLLLAGASVTLALRPDLSLPQPLYALAEAVQARGLKLDQVALISSADWVELITRHDKSLSWS